MKMDYIGKRYGKLVVLQEIERPVGKNYGWRWFRCKCDCGAEKDIAVEKMRNGQTLSCGCLLRRRGPDHKDWSGCGEISGDYYSMCQRRAKGGGKANRQPKEFSVSIEYLWGIFLQQNRKCAISGLDLTFDHLGDRKEHKKSETSKVTASLDRIDSSKGYVEGNVQWVHKHINIMKNDLPQSEFVGLCKAVTKNNP